MVLLFLHVILFHTFNLFVRDSFSHFIYLYIWFFPHDSFIFTRDSFHTIHLLLHVILFACNSFSTWFILFSRDSFHESFILTRHSFHTSHLFVHVIHFAYDSFSHDSVLCTSDFFLKIFCPTRLISFHMWIFFLFDSFLSTCDSFHGIHFLSSD